MKVLISAYACEPHTGSEQGAGWNWSLAAAREHEVWVLTRANNREAIEAELSRKSQPNLHFVYVDLPTWARRWKKGRRGVRLYYVLWQLAALRVAKRLHTQVGFDLVHHVTFANVWLPALTCFVEAPFVLGPVAGGQRIPRSFLRELSTSQALHERVVSSLRRISVINPLIRVACRRASTILCNNEETLAMLPRESRARALLRTNASVSDGLPNRTDRPARTPPSAIVAGETRYAKGINLAMRAIARTPDWRLRIIGSGPDEPRLRSLAQDLGIGTRVEFSGRLEQHELWNLMAAASAVLVPSLREGASFVAAEAAAIGVPVIAFDHHGPRTLAALSPAQFRLIAPESPQQAIDAIARALAEVRLLDPGPTDAFSIPRLAEELERIYLAAFHSSKNSLGAPPSLGRSRID